MGRIRMKKSVNAKKAGVEVDEKIDDPTSDGEAA
jgi:hypothetical protein